MATAREKWPAGTGSDDDGQGLRDLRADLYREVMEEVRRELFASDVVAEHDRAAGMRAMSAAVQQEVRRLRTEMSATRAALRELVVETVYARSRRASSEDEGVAVPAEARRAILRDLLTRGLAAGLGLLLQPARTSGADPAGLPPGGGPWCHGAVALTPSEVLADQLEWDLERPFLLERHSGCCRYHDRESGRCGLDGGWPEACRLHAVALSSGAEPCNGESAVARED